MKKILIVSYGDDSHKNCLVSTAERLGHESILFDAGGYPNTGDELSVDLTGTEPAIKMHLSNSPIKPGEIAGVWWRRPRGSKANQNLNGLDQYKHLEGEVLIRSLADLLPNANWISDPEATRMACRKTVQLVLAKKMGIKIPLTCLGNSPESVKSFVSYLKGRKMIVKPIGTSFIDMSKDKGESKVVFTKIIEPSLLLENIDLVKNCPVIFQEAVEKEYDLRITVVDNKVFSAKVVLEGCSDPSNVDWRNHDGKRQYERHSLPEEIAGQCAAFTKAIGLRFGCIDMAYSKKGGYTFFEINPQGQWLPSEYDLQYPISTALLESLVKY